MRKVFWKYSIPELSCNFLVLPFCIKVQGVVKLINITSDTITCIILPIVLNKWYVTWLLVYLLCSEEFVFFLSLYSFGLWSLNPSSLKSNDESVNVKILYFDIRQNNFIRIIIVLFNMFNKWVSQQQKKETQSFNCRPYM